jgi:hypothetical protein
VERLRPSKGWRAAALTFVVVLVVAACGSSTPTPAASGQTAAPARSGAPASAVAAPTITSACDTPAPSPDPAVRAGTLCDTLLVGKEEQITLVSAYIGGGNTGVPPGPGNVYASLAFQIQSLADDASYDFLYFTAQDERGARFNPVTTGMAPMLATSDRFPKGTIVTGWVNFELPLSFQQLTVMYDPSLGTADQAVVFQVAR